VLTVFVVIMLFIGYVIPKVVSFRVSFYSFVLS